MNPPVARASTTVFDTPADFKASYEAAVRWSTRTLHDRTATMQRGRLRCLHRGLQIFGLGTSWGGFESLVMPAGPHHLRSKPVLPDDGRLVRLHIGLEHPDDRKSDLAQALTNLTLAPH